MARKNNRKLWGEFIRSGATQKSSGTPTLTSSRSNALKGFFLGIDPSLRGTGISVVKSNGKTCQLVHSEVFRFPPTWPHNSCLGEISRRIDELFSHYSIDQTAIENAIYVQNFRTALTLGAARGAAIAAVALRGVPIFEYPPLRIKQALCGYGRASKEQIRKTLIQLVEGVTEKISLDESDATAVALCHWYTYRPALEAAKNNQDNRS